MELTKNKLSIGSTISIYMFPNPDFPQKEQAQAAIDKAKKILNQYSPIEIQIIIARERNLEEDAIKLENIAEKELLSKKIKDTIDNIAQLEREKKAIIAEIQKAAAQKKKAEQNKIKKQARKEKEQLQKTQPKELPLPKLPIPSIKPPKSKLHQTIAIKRTLMRANNCNSEKELREVYFDYCERTDSRCIFKHITNYSAWHYTKKTNLLEIFISDKACDIFHDSSSSSDDS
jgi:paraquat-inducible protein B